MKKTIILTFLCLLFSTSNSQVIYTVYTPTILSQNASDVKVITKVYFGNFAALNNHSVTIDNINKKVNLVSCYNYQPVLPAAPTLIYTVNIGALPTGNYDLNYTVFVVTNYTSCESPEDTTIYNTPFYAGPNYVQQTKANTLFKVAPNPVKDMFKISASINTDFEKLEIVNILGDKVLEVNDPALNSNIDISILPKGIYLVKFYVDKQTFFHKIIKE